MSIISERMERQAQQMQERRRRAALRNKDAKEILTRDGRTYIINQKDRSGGMMFDGDKRFMMSKDSTEIMDKRDKGGDEHTSCECGCPMQPGETVCASCGFNFERPDDNK